MIRTLYDSREIWWVLTKRDIVARYRGSILGIIWPMIFPLIMLSIYTFVYNVIFKAKWDKGGETTQEFALILFVGIILFNFFAECVNRAPTIILSNVSYVKKIIFPLEMLPLSVLGSALFHLVISFMMWILFYIILYKSVPPWTVIWLPLVLLPLLFFIISAVWFLAATGVYLRDLQHVMTLMMSVMIFITPIFYPLSAVPKKYQYWYYLNPLTFVVEQARNVLIWKKMPNWADLVLISLVYLLLVVWSFRWFQTAKKGFADVV